MISNQNSYQNYTLLEELFDDKSSPMYNNRNSTKTPYISNNYQKNLSQTPNNPYSVYPNLSNVPADSPGYQATRTEYPPFTAELRTGHADSFPPRMASIEPYGGSGCKNTIEHFRSCDICKGYMGNKMKIYWIIIAVLVVIIIFLFYRERT